jgi:hypothetical protein
MSFPLFSSIKPPADTEALGYLRQCVSSWKTAGFDVVAINGPNEREAISRLSLPIELHRLPHDGKPRIGEILAAIRERSCPFAGIINSDCKLIGYPDLAASLCAGLDGAAALAWRLEVNGNAGSAILPLPSGYDAFFFDAHVIPDDDLCFYIGDPWWDVWFPLALAANGAKIAALSVPLMTHRVHVQNWNWTAFLTSGNRVWGALKSWRTRWTWSLFADIPDEWWRQERLNRVQLNRLALFITGWFRGQRTSITILPPDLAEIETALRLCGETMIKAALDNGDSQAKEELAAIRNSTSWRMTKPLRAVRRLARTMFP